MWVLKKNHLKDAGTNQSTYGPQRKKICLRGLQRRKQQRDRPACPSAQTDQRLCYSLIGNYHI